MQKGGVGRPKLLKNAVLALMFMTADVSKPSFYPLPTMTSSIFMPYSLAHAVQDLSCMLSSMALMATYKQGNGTKECSQVLDPVSSLRYRCALTLVLFGI